MLQYRVAVTTIAKPEDTADSGCLLLTQNPSTDNEGCKLSPLTHCGWRSLLRRDVPCRLHPHSNDKFEYSIMMVMVMIMIMMVRSAFRKQEPVGWSKKAFKEF